MAAPRKDPRVLSVLEHLDSSGCVAAVRWNGARVVDVAMGVDSVPIVGVQFMVSRGLIVASCSITVDASRRPTLYLDVPSRHGLEFFAGVNRGPARSFSILGEVTGARSFSWSRDEYSQGPWWQSVLTTRSQQFVESVFRLAGDDVEDVLSLAERLADREHAPRIQIVGDDAFEFPDASAALLRSLRERIAIEERFHSVVRYLVAFTSLGEFCTLTRPRFGDDVSDRWFRASHALRARFEAMLGTV